eukprot:TRINITY_DN6654_c0_g1_i1.p1 TRINITY_DN6654_c0_g1~~TRINITY_DN6654_c0_g1_i1.p1  ORF type:complete len:858 (-),score=262.01 TRINITY_DN6654_c0_g1_i1:371-2944(-)
MLSVSRFSQRVGSRAQAAVTKTLRPSRSSSSSSADSATRSSSAITLAALAVGATVGVGIAYSTFSSPVFAAEDPARVAVRKTDAERDLIRKAIDQNRLVRLLDEDQKAALIELLVPLDIKAGQALFRESDESSSKTYFYILESGKCEVINHHGDKIKSIRRGESFGEGSFVMRKKRSATVKAKTDCRVWVIDRDSFSDIVLPSSERLQRLFEKEATSVDSNGRKLMSFGDFWRSIDSKGSVDASQRLRYLFEVADKDKNNGLDFIEFALFDLIASKPDAEYELAFMVFDTGNNGVVTKHDVVRTLSNQQTHAPGFKFDFECSLLRRFFGTDGKRALRPSEFSQFYLGLSEEIPRQLFRFYDKESKGYITSEQFEALLQDSGNWRVHTGLQERIETLGSLRRGAKVVTVGEFLAFSELLNHIPAVNETVRRATTLRGNRAITKEEFKQEALANVAYNITPLEVDVIFAIFDTNNDGRVDYNDFRCVQKYGHACSTQELASLDAAPGAKKARGPKSATSYIQEFFEHFGLGAIAGGVGATAVYPIDLVKTRMQNQRKSKNLADASQVLYKNSWDCFRKVLANEGVLGLYRGLLPQLMGVAPEKAIKLTINDLLRDLFYSEDRGQIYFPLEVLAGCGAGASQVIFTNPIEIVKIRLQVMGENARLDPTFKPKGAWTIVKELGLSGLYKGAGACLLRDIPFSGIYFPAYAAGKTYLTGPDGQLAWYQIMLAGAIAGIPAASLVTPADVIKTRLQVERRTGQQVYKGIVDCAQKVVSEEGFWALYKGAAARVFRSSPQFGVTLAAYEYLQKLFGGSHSAPPTNAPVSSEDLEQLRRADLASKLARLQQNLRIKSPEEPSQKK